MLSQVNKQNQELSKNLITIANDLKFLGNELKLYIMKINSNSQAIKQLHNENLLRGKEIGLIIKRLHNL